MTGEPARLLFAVAPTYSPTDRVLGAVSQGALGFGGAPPALPVSGRLECLSSARPRDGSGRARSRTRAAVPSQVGRGVIQRRPTPRTCRAAGRIEDIQQMQILLQVLEGGLPFRIETTSSRSPSVQSQVSSAGSTISQRPVAFCQISRLRGAQSSPTRLAVPRSRELDGGPSVSLDRVTCHDGRECSRLVPKNRVRKIRIRIIDASPLHEARFDCDSVLREDLADGAEQRRERLQVVDAQVAEWSDP